MHPSITKSYICVEDDNNKGRDGENIVPPTQKKNVQTTSAQTSKIRQSRPNDATNDKRKRSSQNCRTRKNAEPVDCDIDAMLALHNAKFKPKFSYVPSVHRTRDVKEVEFFFFETSKRLARIGAPSWTSSDCQN